MFRRLFEPDSDLMILMSWITDIIFLSLFWIAGSVLVLTAGASAAALYDAVFYGFRKRSKHSWGRFWRTWLKSLKASLVPTVLCVPLGIGIGWAGIQLWNGAVTEGNWMLLAVGAVIGVVLLGMMSILFPMLSRFENSLGQLLGNTVRLSLAHLPRTVAVGLIQSVTVFACVRLVIPVFLLPALSSLLTTLFIEPMFKPYLPEDFYEILSEN